MTHAYAMFEPQLFFLPPASMQGIPEASSV